MKRFLSVIILATPVLVAGCLPMTPAEAGARLLLCLGGGCVLGLRFGIVLFQVEGKKPAAWFVLGACLLIGGGLIALGGWGIGWWGQ